MITNLLGLTVFDNRLVMLVNRLWRGIWVVHVTICCGKKIGNENSRSDGVEV